MLLTLGVAREEVAEVLPGECPESDKVRSRINAAQRRLMLRADWKNTLQAYRFHSCDRCITLPHEIEAIRHVEIGGASGSVQNKWYEYLENGPGTMAAGGGAAFGLIDRGSMHVVRTEPRDRRLVVYSTDAYDDGKEVFISGCDVYGNPVVDDTDDPMAPGTRLTLGLRNPRYTRQGFRKVTSIVKPRTKGLVHVFAYDTGTRAHELLTTLLPWETAPVYRRYEVKGCPSGGQCIDVLAKRRHIDAWHDEAVLTIQNVDAIKEMVAALEDAANNDLESAEIKESRAVRLLKHEHRNAGSPEVNIEVQMRYFGYDESIGMGSYSFP